mgnify:FL=1|tara:strand:- start:8 stop:334 length:327 start_codon:yes stop_codon:yes gene_type:complete
MANTLTSSFADLTTSDPTVLTAGVGETLTIIGCSVANVHATTAAWVTATIYASGGGSNAILCKEVNIPINDAFNPILGKLVLTTGMYLKMDAQANSSLEVTLSYLKQT